MKQCVVYRVRAKAHPSREGFRRGGRFFRADTPTELTEAEMTDAIRREPQLIIERISDLATANDPNLVIGQLRREKAALEETVRHVERESDQLNQKAATHFADAQQLRSENAALQTQLTAQARELEQTRTLLASAEGEITNLRLQIAQISRGANEIDSSSSHPSNPSAEVQKGKGK